MLDKYNFDIGVWYMTKDYRELVRVERNGAKWSVISYADWQIKLTSSLKSVMAYMDNVCISHNHIKEELSRYGE